MYPQTRSSPQKSELDASACSSSRNSSTTAASLQPTPVVHIFDGINSSLTQYNLYNPQQCLAQQQTQPASQRLHRTRTPSHPPQPSPHRPPHLDSLAPQPNLPTYHRTPPPDPPAPKKHPKRKSPAFAKPPARPERPKSLISTR